MSIDIEAWQRGNEAHRRAFADINSEWLNEFFRIEETDAAMFADPQGYIIDKGGIILFAREKDALLGTVCLFPIGDGVFELGKMGVRKNTRGKGIGRILAAEAISWARRKGIPKLYIASNRKLEQAIALYKSLGFVELSNNDDPRYARCDITLEMDLSPKEIGGRKGPDPVRYGDWESAGKCVDF